MNAKQNRPSNKVRVATQPFPIVLYSTDDGNVTVRVVFAKETFWLTQKTMAELFGVNVPAVSKHLKNIFEIGELSEEAVVSKMETTAAAAKKARKRTKKSRKLSANN